MFSAFHASFYATGLLLGSLFDLTFGRLTFSGRILGDSFVSLYITKNNVLLSYYSNDNLSEHRIWWQSFCFSKHLSCVVLFLPFLDMAFNEAQGQFQRFSSERGDSCVSCPLPQGCGICSCFLKFPTLPEYIY